MIIIDRQSTEKLIRTLRSRTNAEGGYCIHFIDAAVRMEESRPRFLAQIEQRFTGSELYICEDGDAFLLAPGNTLKECKNALLYASTLFGVEPVERVGEIYVLGGETGAILILLEDKIKAYRKAEKDQVARQEQAKAAAATARKRQEILDQDAHRSAEQIAAQRDLRSEPVLMIIEDDPFSRRLVENVFQKQYCLKGLASAEGALSTYADTAPDMLLLDINLPDVTGHELLEKIIAIDPKAYVVMLSGNADKNNVTQAMQRGAVGFVAKPFSRDKLFQYIERCPTINREKMQ